MKHSPFRRYLWCFVGSAAVIAILVAALVAAIDPYGERQGGSWRSFASSPLTVPRYAQALRASPHTLVFGTSRSRFVSSAVLGRPTLNLHALYGNPRAVLEFLRRLDPDQIANIRGIIYLLDGHTFDGDAFYDPVDYSSPFDAWRHRLVNFGQYLRDARVKLMRNVTGDLSWWVGEDGATWSNETRQFDGSIRKTEDRRRVTADALSHLAEIDQFAPRHAVAIDYVVPPLPAGYLPLIDLQGFDAQLRGFAPVLPGGFVDMTFTPQISGRNDLFYDVSHLNAAGTAMAFRELLPKAERITRETVERHLQQLHNRIDTLGPSP